MSLTACNTSSHLNASRPEPFGPTGPARAIPETANVQLPCNQTRCSNVSKSHQASVAVVVGIIVLTIALSAIGILLFTQHRRQKQKLGSSFDVSDARLSVDEAKAKGVTHRKYGSPLMSLEYSHGWDPLADGRNLSAFSQEVFHSFKFNWKRWRLLLSISRSEIEGILLFKGPWRVLPHYEFVPNGNLLRYLDVKEGDSNVLEWSTRVSIVKGIAKGLSYMDTSQKPALVHQNISAEKHSRPALLWATCSRIHHYRTVYEKSDVYAFGVLVFQILSGKRKVINSMRLGAESADSKTISTKNLNGRFFEYEASKLAKTALLCTHESPIERPSMGEVVQELSNCSSCL
ncbi:hypothetical protein M0R45_037894 [Rubus argutus]|uniref:Serine-threonine/tyrosine-protein kinase catalytic domain-containing protein n=1 Tax=Rubus argutus TaxID=59490 RepID=A0AAW1W0X0_RUBAR